MRSAWIVNLALVLAVAGLGGYAWYRSNQPQEVSHKLSALSATAVKKIEVAPQAGAGYTLEKRGEMWFVTAPFAARADQTQVQRLLDLLSASSKEKLAATDLKRFDLDAPKLKVTIDGQTYAFGTSNPLTQEQYVSTGDSVYLVSAYYMSLIPGKPDRLLTHSVLTAGEKPVGFTLKGFRVEQKDGKWIVLPEPAEQDRPSQDDLNRWADEWRLSSSLLTQPWDGKGTGEAIEVALADGKRIRLVVLRKEPELILGRPDEKLQFHFSGEVSQRLLKPAVTKEAKDK